MTECNLCDVKKYEVIYDGVIRDGIVGTKSKDTHKVVKCSGCGLVRLLNNPLTMEYYQSDEYRNAYNETANANDYIQMHDNEQPPRLAKVGADMFRDKIVLDYGCGGGAFLDLVSGLADKTVGVEPFGGYHDSLNERGHQIFSDSAMAKKEYQNKVDTIVSFGVLEHVEDPKQYLKDALDLMGLKISHSVEYNFNDQLSLVADFGLNWLFWNFSSSSEDYSEDYYTDYVEKSQNELNANLGISYTKLSLHFKLNN